MSVDTPSTRGGLLGRVSHGVRWSIAEMVAQQVVRLGITVVLARLVAPNDFGLLAMALVFTQLAVMVSDLGLGSALQQRSEVEQRHVSTATTIATLLGLVLGVAAAIASGAIATFFKEPGLTEVVLALSVTFVIRGISTVPRDLLRRDLAFDVLAKCSVFSIAISGVVAIALAVNGAGVLALVAQVLIENGIAAVLICVSAFSKRVWRPGVRCDTRSAKELMGFGLSVSGTRLAYYGATNIDNLVIGRVLGSSALGLYNLAYRLMLMPILKVADVIAVVTMPALASIKDDPKRVASAYLRTVRIVAFACVPVSVATSVLAPALIPAVFGDRWTGAVVVVQILALNGLRLSVGRMSGVVFEAMGRPARDLTVMVATFVVFTAAVLVSVDNGIVAVAVALTIAGYLLVPMDLILLKRTIPLELTKLASALMPVLLAGGLTALSLFGVLEVLESQGPMVLSFTGVAVAAAVYLAAIRVVAPTLLAESHAVIRRRPAL